jgi:fumarate hydratase class II
LNYSEEAADERRKGRHSVPSSTSISPRIACLGPTRLRSAEKAAALVNRSLGKLDVKGTELIVRAADEVFMALS